MSNTIDNAANEAVCVIDGVHFKARLGEAS